MTSADIDLISDSIDEGAVWRSRRSSSGDTRPMVLLLHGLGSHEMDLAGLVPHLPDGFQYASLRGIHRYGAGFAWLEADLTTASPEPLQTSAAAVERWIREQEVPVVGAIGFSQGAMLALQLLRRDPHVLDWIAQLSGGPFPAPMPGDAALAAVRPPALWGHGGLDPLFDEEREELVRAFMRQHTDLTEVRSPHLGHGIDETVLLAVRDALLRHADEQGIPPEDLGTDQR